MIFDNGVDKVEFNIPNKFTKIGVKVSGGADSALVAYMLAQYKLQERNDLHIHPMTCVASTKPYQEIYSKKVIDAITKNTGVEFAYHFVGKARTDDDLPEDTYIKDQTNYFESLVQDNTVQCTFSGITQNPPVLFDVDGPIDDRSKTKKYIRKTFTAWTPLINVDKQGVAQFYKKYNLLDWLFPVTRSCEKHTNDFDKHCGWCWFCQERKWGFGRL